MTLIRFDPTDQNSVQLFRMIGASREELAQGVLNTERHPELRPDLLSSLVGGDDYLSPEEAEQRLNDLFTAKFTSGLNAQQYASLFKANLCPGTGKRPKASPGEETERQLLLDAWRWFSRSC